MSSELHWVRVCDEADLKMGDIKPVSLGAREAIVCRTSDGLAALERRCLHAGADLAEGVIVGERLVCPVHGWCFRAKTGEHVQSPENRLAIYRVRVKHGAVYVGYVPE